MENASILFVNILVMLIYAVPGFVLVKVKMMNAGAIPGLNTLLLYVAQPCLVYYSLTKVAFEPRILLNMLWTFLISFGVMMLAIGGFYVLNKRRVQESVALRIGNIALGFGNCTFMGMPLIEALLPEYPEASIYSIMFFLSMCIIGWTFACFVISGNREYISVRKIVLNPATVSLVLFMPFFVLNYAFPDPLNSSLVLLGRMSTPLCMLILGIRLATLSLKPILVDKSKYLIIALRQIVVPLLYLAVCLILPIEANLKISLVIYGATPVAAMVLNYAELLKKGQDYAAGIMILSSLTAVLTMPVMVMLVNAVI